MAGHGRISRVRLSMCMRGGGDQSRFGGVVHGLARGRRCGSRRTNGDRTGRGHARQPDSRVFGRGASGRSKTGPAPARGAKRCPHLHVAAADPAREARFFERVTLAVDDVVPAPRC